MSFMEIRRNSLRDCSAAADGDVLFRQDRSVAEPRFALQSGVRKQVRPSCSWPWLLLGSAGREGREVCGLAEGDEDDGAPEAPPFRGMDERLTGARCPPPGMR